MVVERQTMAAARFASSRYLASAAAGRMTSATHLVSPAWLAANLAHVSVLDGSWFMPSANRKPGLEHQQGPRIPGSRWFDLDGVADKHTTLPHMLPSAADFSEAASQLGISHSRPVVVYDTAGLFSAARVWWTLRAFGHVHAAVLDGGLPLWMAEGHPVERGETSASAPAVPPEQWTLQGGMVRSLAQVTANVRQQDGGAPGELVVDARAAGRFTAEAPEPRPGLPSGHIPHSRNVPFGALLDSADHNRLVPEASLRAAFERAGVPVDGDGGVVTSCGSGTTAAILYLGLALCGRPLPSIALYDGSWTEWASQPDSVTVKETGLPRAVRPKMLRTAAAALAASSVTSNKLQQAPVPNGYALYYGDAGVCESDNPPSWAHCTYPVATMWLQRATFDSAGKLQSKVNLTSPDEGMAYITTHPSGESILFATEAGGGPGDVNTYILNLTGAPGSNQPVEFLSNISALTDPCRHSKPDPCVDASTFHAVFSPSAKSVYFAYRVWDGEGNGIGNQAIGVAAPDGSAMRGLTFTTAGPDGGINIIDMCPGPVLDESSGLVLFLRTENQGATTYLAVLDSNTGTVTMMTQLPQWGETSGCPNYVSTPDGMTVIYMACLEDCGMDARREHLVVNVTRAPPASSSYSVPHWAAWGVTPRFYSRRATSRRATSPREAAGGTVYQQYMSVTLQPGADPSAWTAAPWFPVPLVNTTDYLDTYAITQCDAIHGLPSAGTITCQGASPQVSTFQMLFVDAKTGASSANSTNTFKACMSPRCNVMQALY